MSEPRFGNCRDCACWNGTEVEVDGYIFRRCTAPTTDTRPTFDDGSGFCFDHIPTTEDRNG